jgi:ABC-type Zn uptake system ZnuABC Zn-binding protein ZnuA
MHAPRTALGLALLVAAALAGCRKPAGRAVAVATVGPVADLVARVAGDDAELRRLVPEGAAAGAPPADAAAKLSGVRLAVRVGLGFDDWLDALAKQANPKVRSLAIGDRVPTRTSTLPARAAGAGAGRDPHEDPVRIDPYVWLDPQRMRLAVKAIGEELARADAAHANAYRFRAGALDEALGRVDDALEARLRACAPAPIVADEPVLGYFAERYGIAVVTVLRPFGAKASAEWDASVRAALAELPQANVVVTAREVPEEARALGRPILHVPILDQPVETAALALADALCPGGAHGGGRAPAGGRAPGNVAAPLPSGQSKP